MNSFIENADPLLQYIVSTVPQNTSDKTHDHDYPQGQDRNNNHNHRIRLNISFQGDINEIEEFRLVELNFEYLLTVRKMAIGSD